MLSNRTRVQKFRQWKPYEKGYHFDFVLHIANLKSRPFCMDHVKFRAGGKMKITTISQINKNDYFSTYSETKHRPVNHQTYLNKADRCCCSFDVQQKNFAILDNFADIFVLIRHFFPWVLPKEEYFFKEL